MHDPSHRRGPRLTVDDWVDAALHLLVEEGPGAVKVSRLCDRLAVTKGSFYWHFIDTSDLMSALMERCRHTYESFRDQLSELAGKPPRQRIEILIELSADPARRALERAARSWSETEPRLAESVAALDEQIVGVTHAALRDLGFDEAQARVRATTALYAGIGYLHSTSRHSPESADDRQIFVDLLTSR